MKKIKMIVTYAVHSEALLSKTGDKQIFASALEENLVEYPLLMERNISGASGTTLKDQLFNQLTKI
jgi:hypothetical protein